MEVRKTVVEEQTRCQQDKSQSSKSEKSMLGRFPRQVSGFAKGAVRVNKTEFLEHLDTGIAGEQRQTEIHSNVLMIYQHKNSFPRRRRSEIITQGTEIPQMSFEEATENCHSVHVVSTKPSMGFQQCFAMVGQYESFEIDRFVRVNVGHGEVNLSLPLTRVGRGVVSSGVNEFRVPHQTVIRRGVEFVKRYAKNLQRNTKDLKPILEKTHKNNTVIVMLSNYGQSELLVNFVCRARARNVNLDSVLIVCTDEVTERVAKSLGLTTYFDKKVRVCVYVCVCVYVYVCVSTW